MKRSNLTTFFCPLLQAFKIGVHPKSTYVFTLYQSNQYCWYLNSRKLVFLKWMIQFWYFDTLCISLSLPWSNWWERGCCCYCRCSIPHWMVSSSRGIAFTDMIPERVKNIPSIQKHFLSAFGTLPRPEKLKKMVWYNECIFHTFFYLIQKFSAVLQASQITMIIDCVT